MAGSNTLLTMIKKQLGQMVLVSYTTAGFINAFVRFFNFIVGQLPMIFVSLFPPKKRTRFGSNFVAKFTTGLSFVVKCMGKH